MNELLTDKKGRMPFVLDDIRFLDSIYRNAILSLIGGLSNNEDLIIAGINLENTGGVEYFATGGVIYFNGELLAVNDKDITIPMGYKAVIERKEAYDPAGKKLFGDGTLVDTYKLVYGEFSVVLTSQTGQFEITSARLGNLFEPAFAKNTAFNKNFGGGSLDVEPGINNPSQIKKKVYNIGPWNMTGINVKVIYHGFAPEDLIKIVSITGVIFSDAGFPYPIYDIPYSNTTPTGLSIDSTQILIFREASSIFDTTLFDDAVINRGYLIIEYLP